MENKFGNAPLPSQFQGETLEEALHDYQTAIIGMFQDAQDAGHPIKVHSLQIMHQTIPAKDYRFTKATELFTVVAFIQEDESAVWMNSLNQIVSAASQMLQAAPGEKECDHEFGEGMKCSKCGIVL